MISLPGIRFGWSQAGFQSEMGLPGSEDPNSDWFAWVHDKENIAAGVVSGDLPEYGPAYWHRFREFHDAAERMELKIARIGVEWSRVFPKPTLDVQVDIEQRGDMVTHVDVSQSQLEKMDAIASKDAVEHYRTIFSDLKRRGIEFVLNLYHWPLPLWIHDPVAVRRGEKTERTGWLSTRTVVEFAKFAAYISWKLDDLVDAYSTMNEPNVVWGAGYTSVKSGFPPGYLSFAHSSRAMYNMVQAHARAFDVLKTHKKPVGIIYANSDFQGLTAGDADVASKAEFDNRWRFFEAIVNGDLGGYRDDLKGRLEWIGVNYYTRSVVRKAGEGYVVVRGYGHACERNSLSADGRPTSDFGWEFYPEGLGNVLVKYWEKYGLPLYVTENGIADEADYQRPYYLVSHIYQVYQALRRGADVKGYLHWSLADNYEWASGFTPRFGLLRVDYTNKSLFWNPSAFVYKEIAGSNGIPDQLEHLNRVPPTRGLRR
ncbi:beta-galactosidase [Candidatus Marsarchaeota G2 archaeon OSP_D]|jgi:Beta-glucosidase/6-phospho-beta-glucosidase/beta-galactosidase|uniref:Beta-galactosidase n=1 Tax=Candidatus Marsarchaeota G2 archaeon OSP_D TaxID=1978157 RepID=A0A2R6AW03_9ARCH|nr:MAG: beta-galactosidase [Candidatus Marsarchaeota G2 archaeon OSP_D]